MNDLSFNEQIDAALQTESPSMALIALAREFKADGMSHQIMIQLFDAHRSKHESDSDETVYNAILDAMDFIVGYCRKSDGLFDAD
jgi:hypothetical protein